MRASAHLAQAWFTVSPAVIYTFPSLNRSCCRQERRIFHAQTYIPAEPSPPLEGPRLSHPDEDQERTRRHFPAPRQGAQKSFG